MKAAPSREVGGFGVSSPRRSEMCCSGRCPGWKTRRRGGADLSRGAMEGGRPSWSFSSSSTLEVGRDEQRGRTRGRRRWIARPRGRLARVSQEASSLLSDSVSLSPPLSLPLSLSVALSTLAPFCPCKPVAPALLLASLLGRPSSALLLSQLPAAGCSCSRLLSATALGPFRLEIKF